MPTIDITHAEEIDKLLTKLAKITRHTPANAIVYRSTLFTASDEHGRSSNTDDWSQAAELELLAEEPYATFLRRILAATGLSPTAATPHHEPAGHTLSLRLR